MVDSSFTILYSGQFNKAIFARRNDGVNIHLLLHLCGAIFVIHCVFSYCWQPGTCMLSKFSQSKWKIVSFRKVEEPCLIKLRVSSDVALKSLGRDCLSVPPSSKPWFCRLFLSYAVVDQMDDLPRDWNDCNCFSALTAPTPVYYHL